MLQFILTVAIFVSLVILLAQCVVLFFETFIPDLYSKPEAPKNKLNMTTPEFKEFESVVTGKPSESNFEPLEEMIFHNPHIKLEEAALKNAENFGQPDVIIFEDEGDYKAFAKSVKKSKKKKNKKKSKKSSKRKKK